MIDESKDSAYLEFVNAVITTNPGTEHTYRPSTPEQERERRQRYARMVALETLRLFDKRPTHELALEQARAKLPELGLHGVLKSDWERFNALMRTKMDETMGAAWRGDPQDFDDLGTIEDVMIRMVNQLAGALYRVTSK